MNGARLFVACLLLVAGVAAYDMARVRTWNGVPDASMAVKLSEAPEIVFTEYTTGAEPGKLTPRMMFTGNQTRALPRSVACKYTNGVWECHATGRAVEVISIRFNNTAATEGAAGRIIVRVPDDYIIPQTAVLTFGEREVAEPGADLGKIVYAALSIGMTAMGGFCAICDIRKKALAEQFRVQTAASASTPVAVQEPPVPDKVRKPHRKHRRDRHAYFE